MTASAVTSWAGVVAASTLFAFVLLVLGDEGVAPLVLVALIVCAVGMLGLLSSLLAALP